MTNVSQNFLPRISETIIKKFSKEQLLFHALKKGYDLDFEEDQLELFSKDDVVEMIYEQFRESSTSVDFAVGITESDSSSKDGKKDKVPKRKGMQKVDPIRDPNQISQMLDLLNEQSLRNGMLFLFGINIGCRISDTLSLTVGDLKKYDYRYADIKEQKTNKTRKFFLNKSIQEKLKEYVRKNKLKDDDYLFASRKKSKGKQRPISRVQAWKILNDAGKSVGITDKIGTHTLRKTYGYHYFKQFKDLSLLMDEFNHSSQAVTLLYIGITDDEKKERADHFSLGV